MSAENGMHPERDGRTGGYLLFAWSPDGWQLRERDGDPPAVGAEVEDGGHVLVVTKIGPSPVPGDLRPCAFTSGKA